MHLPLFPSVGELIQPSSTKGHGCSFVAERGSGSLEHRAEAPPEPPPDAPNVKRKRHFFFFFFCSQSHMTPVVQQQKYDRGQRGCSRFIGPDQVKPGASAGGSCWTFSVCQLATSLRKPRRFVSRRSWTLEPENKTVRRSERSTHLVSINWPVPWRRRGVDPILLYSGPVPAALGSVLPLHNRSPQAYSPFLHCGPGPFSLTALSQPGTNGLTNFSAHSHRGRSRPIRRKPVRAVTNYRPPECSADGGATNEV